MQKHSEIFILFVSCFSQLLFASTDEQAAVDDTQVRSPPSNGNFALRGSQQPGPLLSFGQTIIGRNQLQLYLDTFSPYHVGGAFDSLNGSLTYGITDSTSLYINYPIKSNSETRVFRSSSLSDVTLQLEHAFYTVGNTKYQDQATIVGSITLPIQNDTTSRSPRAQGFGSPTYFLGTTYNRTYLDWLGFVSPGVLFTTTSEHIRLGSQYLYQAGLEHTIIAISKQSILFGLLELDGQYTEKDLVRKYYLPNTGGNFVAMTPSLGFSTQRSIAQVGIGFPVVQNLNGNQTKIRYFIAANFSWTIT